MTENPSLRSLTRDRVIAQPPGPCRRDAERALTSAEFDAAVDVAATELVDCGVTAGDTVAVELPNCVEIGGADVRRLGGRRRAHPAELLTA